MIQALFFFFKWLICKTLKHFRTWTWKNWNCCKLVLIFWILVLFNSEMAAQGLKVWETMFTLSTDINSLREFSVFIWSLMFSFSLAFYIELTILLMSYYFPWQTPRWLNYNTDSYLQGALSFYPCGCLGTLSNQLHQAATHWAVQWFCLPLRRIRQF